MSLMRRYRTTVWGGGGLVDISFYLGKVKGFM